MKTTNASERSGAWIKRIRAFFMAQPLPSVVFQVSASAFSGINVSVSEKKIRHRAYLPLASGLVEPHFDKPNIKQPASLAAVLKEGLAKLHYSGDNAACLLPEPCLKVFIFAFDSLPSSERERLKLFRWRAKKQLPLLPDDVRLSYQIMKSNANASPKVLVSMARSAVLQEYEDLFASAGVKVGMVSSPTLSLLNLLNWAQERSFILVNIEDDSVSLAAVADAELTLFRLKTFPAARSGLIPERHTIENIVTEIENTVHFLEDREKRSPNALWVRSRSAEFLKSILSELESRLPLPVKLVDSPWLAGANTVDQALLAPLFGQV
ncbi:MAG: hypothetical protein QHH14_10550 [Clostridiales bacterium]|nr:hypothetical protein [Clostridiales bacterium]